MGTPKPHVTDTEGALVLFVAYLSVVIVGLGWLVGSWLIVGLGLIVGVLDGLYIGWRHWG